MFTFLKLHSLILLTILLKLQQMKKIINYPLTLILIHPQRPKWAQSLIQDTNVEPSLPKMTGSQHTYFVLMTLYEIESQTFEKANDFFFLEKCHTNRIQCIN